MEIYNVFSRAGLIDESWDTNKPRIKMYYDENNEFKGEALIGRSLPLLFARQLTTLVYWKHDSVGRAIFQYDGKDFRGGTDVDGDLQVVVADREYKAVDTTEDNDAKPDVLKKKPKRRPLSERDKQKIKDKQVQMEKYVAPFMPSPLLTNDPYRKLSWNSDEEDTMPGRNYANRWLRMLVFKGMFTPQKLVDDPELYGDVKNDLKDMCEKFGSVTSMVIYDAEPEGVATVRFSTVEEAEACQQKTNGRVYDGTPVRVSHSDGFEKFKKKAVPARKPQDKLDKAGTSEDTQGKVNSPAK